MELHDIRTDYFPLIAQHWVFSFLSGSLRTSQRGWSDQGVLTHLNRGVPFRWRWRRMWRWWSARRFYNRFLQFLLLRHCDHSVFGFLQSRSFLSGTFSSPANLSREWKCLVCAHARVFQRSSHSSWLGAVHTAGSKSLRPEEWKSEVLGFFFHLKWEIMDMDHEVFVYFLI